MQVEMVYRAAPVAPQNPGSVRIIHHHNGTVSFSGFD